ncbi:hypothetical protein [Marinobacter algicola]|uniref:YobI-like P-loop NTPase domain-containing protein n=1 Tax=Marinobacter algicola DG893 TaxID=443152 RepID=A6EVX9_9GAMM|nr:hypothetical protein [Marinobacter algicola]EDM49166.1 hypothetical protein MDG893_07210 [Marinobacter algicola DG893]
MIETVISLTRQLADGLYGIVSCLESKYRSAEMQSKFVDLAPTDKADESGVYSEAILFATNNPKVSNIALTGPYGSGKSSIIQSFLRKYPRPALRISLAAFVPEADSGSDKVGRQEIERSILQQMLYGADANKLPLSRFKRIQSPGFWSFLKSFFIVLGVVALWYVFNQREYFVSGSFFNDLSITNWPFSFSNWFNLGSFLFAFIFLWVTLHHFYVASLGLSLRGISLKDVELKPAHDDQASILNRHLDEIIYFFQSTNYDLVVIEDIDRFEDAEIFVTLREINSLVNENAGVKRTIRFLYALRDDMFINTDRTKFFEFIIPVIPIINTSNSIDMVLKQGRRLELDQRLNQQFLREVSRYLNDLRLIQNIFNEYAIYVANLEIDGENLLDANKLLAILIYKNVYPRDFEQLHRGAGTLAEILNLQDELIRHGEATYKTEIAELEKKLELAERQTPSDLRELQRIYTMALIERLPANITSVRSDGPWIPLKELVGHERFDQLIEAPHLLCRVVNNQQNPVNVSNLQREVNSQKTYHQRKEEIEVKAADSKDKILREIRELRSKIPALRMTKLNELLRLNADRVQDLLESFGENGELARFLILEGYLDDTYYQYTSLFHSGRLSPNDNKFLIQIRAFVQPDPGFPIDNPKEVIAAMRDEDFRQNFVLNVNLVDSLLSDHSRYIGQKRKLFEYLSTDFEAAKDFFDAYYTSGCYVEELLSGLAESWRRLIPAVIASPESISHVTQLVSKLPEESLKKLAGDFHELPEFVSANLPEILANSPELEPKRLACLDLEIKDLAAIKDYSEIVRFMVEEGLFKLTIANLEFVYQAILGEDNLEPLRERNFTTIRSVNNETLLKRIERDFDRYLRDILVELPANSKEDAAAILAVVRHNEVDHDDLRSFLGRQTTQLPSLADVPEELHSMLFNEAVIQPTWENCQAFMQGEGFEAESLIVYLNQERIREAILEQPIPSDSDSVDLRLFLFQTGSLSDVAYKEYIRALPRAVRTLPEGLDSSKIKILIDEGKVLFNRANFDALADKEELQVRFVSTNIEKYLADSESFALDDNFREELLRTDIDDASKLKTIELMDLDALEGAPERSALIGSIISKSDAKLSNLTGTAAQSLIKHSTPIATQISIFNHYHALLTDDEVRNVLAELPKPFSEIKTGYNSPRLETTPENQDLVQWLDSRKFISSWSKGGVLH